MSKWDGYYLGLGETRGHEWLEDFQNNPSLAIQKGLERGYVVFQIHKPCDVFISLLLRLENIFDFSTVFDEALTKLLELAWDKEVLTGYGLAQTAFLSDEASTFDCLPQFRYFLKERANCTLT